MWTHSLRSSGFLRFRILHQYSPLSGTSLWLDKWRFIYTFTFSKAIVHFLSLLCVTRTSFACVIMYSYVKCLITLLKNDWLIILMYSIQLLWLIFSVDENDFVHFCFEMHWWLRSWNIFFLAALVTCFFFNFSSIFHVRVSLNRRDISIFTMDITVWWWMLWWFCFLSLLVCGFGLLFEWRSCECLCVSLRKS